MKLHLGCGKRFLPGYVHVDIADFPHIDFQCPAHDLSQFEDESADLIYASHMLEYWDRVEVRNVLAEWQRVLKPGGILRVGVPNFDALLEVYRQTGQLDRILGPLYGRMPVEGLEQFIYHKTVYSEKDLTDMLQEAGFKDVKWWDWGEIFPPDYDDHSQAYFPHMDKENGILVSLNLEAVK